MNEVHDFLAALCHLRDDLLFPDPSGYDPLSFYSVNLELMSDGERAAGKPNSWRITYRAAERRIPKRWKSACASA
jgi:hypothetical protein